MTGLALRALYALPQGDCAQSMAYSEPGHSNPFSSELALITESVILPSPIKKKVATAGKDSTTSSMETYTS